MTRLLFSRYAGDHAPVPCATPADALDLLTRYGGQSFVDVCVGDAKDPIGFVYPDGRKGRGPWRYDGDRATGRADTFAHAVERLIRETA